MWARPGVDGTRAMGGTFCDDAAEEEEERSSGRSRSKGSDRNLFRLVWKDSTESPESLYMVPVRGRELGGLEPSTDWPRDLRTLSAYVEGGPACLDCVGGCIAFASENGLAASGDVDNGGGTAEL